MALKSLSNVSKKPALSVQTWNTDFSDYFNYEDKEVTLLDYTINFKSQCYYFIQLKNNQKILSECNIFNFLKSYPEAIVLFKLSIDKNNHIQITPIVNDQFDGTSHEKQSKRLWRIIKSQRNYATLEKDVIIKLGRSKLLVKELVDSPASTSQLCQKIYSDTYHQYNTSTALDNPGGEHNKIHSHSTYNNEKSDHQAKNSSSSEVQIENTHIKVCRICLGDDNEGSDPLISPCQCKGSMKYIHLSCLRTWMRGRLKIDETNNSFFLYKLDCELCKSLYPYSIDSINTTTPILDIIEPKSPYIILEFISEERGLYVASLAKNSVVSIGRASNADIKIVNVSVSRYHSFIKYEGGQFYIRDNDSKFGTLLELKNTITIPTHEAIELQFGSLHISLKTKKNKLTNFMSSSVSDISLKSTSISPKMKSEFKFFKSQNNKYNSAMYYLHLQDEQDNSLKHIL